MSIRKFTKKFALIAITTIMISLIFIPKAVNAEGEDTYNTTLNISFKNQDSTLWDFNEYNALGDYKILNSGTGNPISGIEYTYSWSNGETDSGVTDDDGIINFKASSETESTSVTVTINNIPNTAYIVLPDETAQYNYSVFMEKSIENIPVVYSDEENDVFFKQLNEDNSVTALIYPGREETNITYTKTNFTETTTINIDYFHEDESVWTLHNNNLLAGYSSNLFDTGVNVFAYEITLSNGEKFNGLGYRSEDIFSLISDESIDGVTSVSIKLMHSPNTSIHFNKQESNDFSKAIVGTTEIGEEGIDIALTDSDTINTKYYAPITTEWKMGLYSDDESVTEDFRWYPFFRIYASKVKGNIDLGAIYWTIEGEDTKHYCVPEDDYNSCKIQIDTPIGKRVIIHNAPLESMYNWGGAGGTFQGGIYINSTNSNGQATVTYKGEILTEEKLNELGINAGVHIETYDFNGELTPTYTHIGTSGNGPRDGYEYKYYIVRKPSIIMLKKIYNNLNIEEDNKSFHFEITLKDTLTNKPITGKVAYYKYSDANAGLNIDNDVQYATADENGKIDVYLKADEIIKIGKISNKKYGAEDSNLTEQQQNEVYERNLGMLPYGVEYTIVELDSEYDKTISPEGAANGTGSYSTMLYGMEVEEKTGEEIFIESNGIEFLNERLTSNLTIEKIVNGNDNDKKYEFEIKIIDTATKLPDTLNYIKSDGTIGTIEIKKSNTINRTDENNNIIQYNEYNATVFLKNGETITIQGIPVGAEYEVVEKKNKKDNFTSEWINPTGIIEKENNDHKNIATFINNIKEDNISSPKTGDTIVKYIATSIISLLGMNTIIYYRSKKIKQSR